MHSQLISVGAAKLVSVRQRPEDLVLLHAVNELLAAAAHGSARTGEEVA